MSLRFDERLGMLVDAEQLAREHRALAPPAQGSHSENEYISTTVAASSIGADPPARHGSLGHRASDVLITNPNGVGKSYLACALGQQACRQHHRVTYRRISRLFPEVMLAQADGLYPTVLATSRASTS